MLGEAGEGLPTSPLGPGLRARLCTLVARSSTRMLVPTGAALQGQPLPGQSWRQVSPWPLCRHMGGGEGASPSSSSLISLIKRTFHELFS